jgi:hypothetical protein
MLKEEKCDLYSNSRNKIYLENIREELKQIT